MPHKIRSATFHGKVARDRAKLPIVAIEAELNSAAGGKRKSNQLVADPCHALVVAPPQAN